MICAYCKKAGQLRAGGDTPAAWARHQQCPGGTWCDCHHSLTDDINHDLVADGYRDLQDVAVGLANE